MALDEHPKKRISTNHLTQEILCGEMAETLPPKEWPVLQFTHEWDDFEWNRETRENLGRGLGCRSQAGKKQRLLAASGLLSQHQDDAPFQSQRRPIRPRLLGSSFTDRQQVSKTQYLRSHQDYENRHATAENDLRKIFFFDRLERFVYETAWLQHFHHWV